MNATKIERTSLLRRGMTLIELVAVMAILIALAGILVPMLPKMLTRAHTSSSATNSAELTKFIENFHAMYIKYPNNFDSLADTTSGTLLSYVPGSGSSDYTTIDLNTTPAYLDALNVAGITTVATMTTTAGTGDWSATFYPYGNSAAVMPAPTALTSSMKLAGLSSAAATRLYGVNGVGQFVILGIGKYTSMQGKTFQDAPVHFGDQSTANPATTYQRYAAVFKVADANGPLDEAEFVGVGAFHDDSFVTVGDHIQEYFTANRGT